MVVTSIIVIINIIAVGSLGTSNAVLGGCRIWIGRYWELLHQKGTIHWSDSSIWQEVSRKQRYSISLTTMITRIFYVFCAAALYWWPFLLFLFRKMIVPLLYNNAIIIVPVVKFLLLKAMHQVINPVKNMSMDWQHNLFGMLQLNRNCFLGHVN